MLTPYQWTSRISRLTVMSLWPSRPSRGTTARCPSPRRRRRARRPERAAAREASSRARRARLAAVREAASGGSSAAAPSARESTVVTPPPSIRRLSKQDLGLVARDETSPPLVGHAGDAPGSNVTRLVASGYAELVAGNDPGRDPVHELVAVGRRPRSRRTSRSASATGRTNDVRAVEQRRSPTTPSSTGHGVPAAERPRAEAVGARAMKAKAAGRLRRHRATDAAVRERVHRRRWDPGDARHRRSPRRRSATCRILIWRRTVLLAVLVGERRCRSRSSGRRSRRGRRCRRRPRS